MLTVCAPTIDIITAIEGNHIVVALVEIAASLADIARIAFFAEIGQFAWIVDKTDWAEHLESLNGAHADLAIARYGTYELDDRRTKSRLVSDKFGDKHTRLRKSVRNVIELLQIITKLSRPILRNAKSVATKLSISLLPYIDRSIIDSAVGSIELNLSVNRIDTHAIRDPSALYFSDNSSATRFGSANTSSRLRFGELTR